MPNPSQSQESTGRSPWGRGGDRTRNEDSQAELKRFKNTGKYKQCFIHVRKKTILLTSLQSWKLGKVNESGPNCTPPPTFSTVSQTVDYFP